MTSTSKTIIFFGTEDFSLAILTALIEAGYTIGAVVTKPDSKKDRGQQLTPPPVKILASRHNIPVWQPEKLADIIPQIQAFNYPASVLASYGKIIPQTIINLFTPGIINVHPSLLPKYRGPTPIESAIANGDKKTGISIMQLTAKMDAGPVYAAKQYPLDGNETQISLYQALAAAGADLLLESLPNILEGSLSPQPQNEEAASYCSLLSKNDAQLDPTRLTATEAEQKVRAHLVFPKTKLKVRSLGIVITKAHVSAEQKTPLDVRCQDGAFLSIDELIAPSGRRMSGEAFLRGYAV